MSYTPIRDFSGEATTPPVPRRSTLPTTMLRPPSDAEIREILDLVTPATRSTARRPSSGRCRSRSGSAAWRSVIRGERGGAGGPPQSACPGRIAAGARSLNRARHSVSRAARSSLLKPRRGKERETHLRGDVGAPEVVVVVRTSLAEIVPGWGRRPLRGQCLRGASGSARRIRRALARAAPMPLTVSDGLAGSSVIVCEHDDVEDQPFAKADDGGVPLRLGDRPVDVGAPGAGERQFEFGEVVA